MRAVCGPARHSANMKARHLPRLPTGHLLVLLGVGKVLGFSRKELLVASNANIGGGSSGGSIIYTSHNHSGWQQHAIRLLLKSNLLLSAPALPFTMYAASLHRPLHRCGHGSSQGLDVLDRPWHSRFDAGLRHRVFFGDRVVWGLCCICSCVVMLGPFCEGVCTCEAAACCCSCCIIYTTSTTALSPWFYAACACAPRPGYKAQRATEVD